MNSFLFVWSTSLSILTLASAPGEPRTLRFEDRVRAQETIERVYHRHQVGATKPFEQAVPHSVLEAKVRTYLEQTAILSARWKTAVTDLMLQREIERIAGETRMPERLQELYAALGNDPFLVKECLARPILVDRLIHNFYAGDTSLHREARARADELRRRLATGELNLSESHPDRVVTRLAVREAEGDGSEPGAAAVLARHRDPAAPEPLSRDAFEKRQARFPAAPGQVSAVKEDRDAFTVSAVLAATDSELVAATYTVPKATWDTWWGANRKALTIDAIPPVASPVGELPEPRQAISTEIVGECPPDDTWEDFGTNWVPTIDSAVWTGRVMVVLGFGMPPAYRGAHYDPATDSWTSASWSGAPSRRAYDAEIWSGSELIQWGGWEYRLDGDHQLSSSGERYDPVERRWTPTAPEGAPSARAGHSAIWTGREMIVWGGEWHESPYGGDWGLLSTGARYDPVNDTWAPISNDGAPLARSGHSAIWTGREMIVWGGFDEGAHLNSGGRYDPVTDTWSPLSASNAPSARYMHAAIWTGREMIVWGGWNGGTINTGGRYDPESDVWRPISMEGAPSARSRESAIWTGSEMIVWGGYDDRQYLDGARYDPVTDTWSPTSTVAAPTRRGGHRAVWADTQMIVWGGYDEEVSGGRYDPRTDSWTPTALPSGAPSRRRHHTAVWSGNEMIVWGGEGPIRRERRSGGRFDPVTNTWRPMESERAPDSPNPVSVWTGEAMFVVGSDGVGRYDPAQDRWSSTWALPCEGSFRFTVSLAAGAVVVVGVNESTGSPSHCGARYDPEGINPPSPSTPGLGFGLGHVAVSTGREVIAWGPGAGARYDPANDSWTELSLAGAPSVRNAPSAVWTGSEMLVWDGGEADDFRSGGRYDPVGDTWRPMSTLNAPEGASGPTGVWTGREMIVWGGGFPPFWNKPISGGRYDPMADSWRPMSVPGEFMGRRGHTAVWTGRGVAIWGGDFYGWSDDGSQYVVFEDTEPPRGGIVAPASGYCTAAPVTVVDDFADACDAEIARTYAPPGGPTYAGHGDYHVVVTAADLKGNGSSVAVDFTIDTVAPTVEILDPDISPAVLPTEVPLAITFASEDEDGASGGVVREVVRVEGCAILDGLEDGDGDGLLSDETLPLTPGLLCRAYTRCGLTTLSQPELRVEASDCGGNVGAASRVLRGSLALVPGVCGR